MFVVLLLFQKMFRSTAPVVRGPVVISHQIQKYSQELGIFKIPEIKNERMRQFSPGSFERTALQTAVNEMRRKVSEKPFEVSCIVNGKPVTTGDISHQFNPGEHRMKVCNFHNADKETIQFAISSALKVKPEWEAMSFNDRVAIFLKAADLMSNKYRYELLAATMIGQGKNAWQAEVDAGPELIDFIRFNCRYTQEIYANQPTENSTGVWNRMEYRPLEGFVAAICPFNFTAIAGNLALAPALMGNVVLWKPSNSAVYSNYLILKIMKEAGLPDGVLQFLPGDPIVFSEVALTHPDFAGLHFTGSTSVFSMLWKKIGENLDIYKSYPRIVGETGGKNMHFLHESADVKHAVLQTIRGAFEYNGQKCSATSRVYVPDTLIEEFTAELKSQMATLKSGPVEDFTNFCGPVINRSSFDKLQGYINDVKSKKNPSTTILTGGNTSDKVGYFVQPTVLLTTDPKSPTMVTELFGPILTIYAYPATEFINTLDLAEATSPYALTCGM